MKKITFSIIAALLAATLILGLSACSIDINPGYGTGENIHIDLDDINLDDISLENIVDSIEDKTGIDIEEIAESISEKAEPYVEEIRDKVSEYSEDILEIVSGVFGEIGDSDSSGYSYDYDDYYDYDYDYDFDYDFDYYDDYDYDYDYDDDESITAFPYKYNNEFEEPDDAAYIESFSIDPGTEITFDDLRNMDTDTLLEYMKNILEANGMGSYYELIKTQIENNPDIIQKVIDEYLDGLTD